MQDFSLFYMIPRREIMVLLFLIITLTTVIIENKWWVVAREYCSLGTLLDVIHTAMIFDIFIKDDIYIPVSFFLQFQQRKCFG